jgi:hypothetical protein
MKFFIVVLRKKSRQFSKFGNLSKFLLSTFRFTHLGNGIAHGSLGSEVRHEEIRDGFDHAHRILSADRINPPRYFLFCPRIIIKCIDLPVDPVGSKIFGPGPDLLSIFGLGTRTRLIKICQTQTRTRYFFTCLIFEKFFFSVYIW